MKTKVALGVSIGIIIVLMSVGIVWKTQSNPTPTATPTFPDKSDLIRVTAPKPNQTVSHSVHITGEARGSWYFEASFPIHMEDASGGSTALTIAQAQSDWMTSNFVPFQAELAIPASFNGPAVLVFIKDNPSGLPENNDSLRIPITVAP